MWLFEFVGAIRALAPCADAAQHSVLSFRVVYRFENEQLIELINRTAHAAALSALVETPTAYRFYFAVYVHKLSLFTPFYMALIDPFRKLIVYPSLLRASVLAGPKYSAQPNVEEISGEVRNIIAMECGREETKLHVTFRATLRSRLSLQVPKQIFFVR